MGTTKTPRAPRIRENQTGDRGNRIPATRLFLLGVLGVFVVPNLFWVAVSASRRFRRALMCLHLPRAWSIRARSRVWLLTGVLCLVCAGCRGQDRWAHYESGGSFVTAAPSMSPVDGSIVFASPRSGHGDIYLWRPGGATPERLTDDPDFEASPLFSPVGKSVAFLREQGGYAHACLLDLSTRRATPLTSGSVVDEIDSFSPDGKSVIVRRGHYGGGLGLSVESVVINLADPSAIIPVGNSACFAPDNGRIFYSEYDEKTGLSSVWSVDRRGEQRAGVCDGWLRGIVPNGRSLLVTVARATDWRLYDLPTRTRSKPLPLGENTIFAVSTDSTQIVLTQDWGRRLARYELETGRVHPLESPPDNVNALRACKDGFLLVAIGPGDRCGVVYFLDGRSWKTRKLFSIEK
jgi:hypothetical protein